MAEVHRAEVRGATWGEPSDVEAEAAGSAVRSDLEESPGEGIRPFTVRRQHEATLPGKPEIALERAELTERIDLALPVGADAEGRSGGGEAIGGEDAVPQVALGQRARADLRAGEQRDLVRCEVHGVHGGEGVVEEPDLVEEFHGTAAVLGDARLDLALL